MLRTGRSIQLRQGLRYIQPSSEGWVIAPLILTVSDGLGVPGVAGSGAEDCGRESGVTMRALQDIFRWVKDSRLGPDEARLHITRRRRRREGGEGGSGGVEWS
jgi:hypothetical protein